MVDDEFEYSGSYQDMLEDFFTSPTKDDFPDIIQVDKEYDALEFKEEWHEKSKLAKHILAFANEGGGVIVYGVEEKDDGTYVSAGLEDPVDEAKFGDKVEKYIPDNAHPLYALETFRYGDVYDDAISGKTFQVVFVDGASEAAPLVSTNAGNNIDDATIYIRRSTKSERANYQEVQLLLRKRRESGIEKSTAELYEELREQKTLYGEIDKNVTYHVGLGSAVASLSEAGTYRNIVDLEPD
jgi:predicted HTH transcriptional regulator